jgi:hypothetical protein
MMMWKSPHFVAMDGKGKIFDPSPRYPGYYGHDRLDHPHNLESKALAKAFERIGYRFRRRPSEAAR